MSDKKESIIDMIANKREKKIAEEVKRNEFYEQLNNWKMKGYDVSELENLMDNDIEQIESEFSNFNKQIGESVIVSDTKDEKEIEIQKTEKPRKDMGLEASIFIRTLYSKMRKIKPDYSPLGYYLGDENWKVELSQDVYNLTCKSGRLFKELLKIQCNYIILSNSIKNEINEIRKLAKEMKNKNQFHVKCYVVTNIKNESIVNYFNNFIDRNVSIYLYVLSGNVLYFNKEDWKTELFSEWFKKDGKPKSIRELIKNIEDENKIFTINKIIKHLNFNQERAEEFLKKLEEEDKVIQISESKGEYCFVR